MIRKKIRKKETDKSTKKLYYYIMNRKSEVE